MAPLVAVDDVPALPGLGWVVLPDLALALVAGLIARCLALTGVAPVRLFRASSEQGAEGAVASVLEVQWRSMRSAFPADGLRLEVV